MSDLLIVASPTSQPLCTDVPVPWPLHWVPDGPFPFTVARWAECPDEPRYVSTNLGICGAEDCDCCWADMRVCWCGGGPLNDTDMSCGSGAVVELVEVVGPSHHSDDCADPYGIGAQARDAQGRTRCDPDALPDCWHTPTGTVTPLAEPIPCERSWQCGACGPDCGDAPSCNGEVRPSVWVADGSVHEQLRGATSQ